ncbi:hypothetical protein C8F04DRAFT_131803 [Mycena alexandri]|uniref:NmrA-like domain-containing protein n=1 Tax=Mycena alexandri TaxID=1745969 RepID=A0AAD6WYD8_9AGAR|nr:hypothetical protein C8F04DRAFT_131803 [Mycena alexandri]
MKNILFIGGTGYIGGPILSRFIEREDPNLTLTALVRSPEKAEKLRKLDLRGLNLVIGSHNDATLVERLVSEADIVFSLADCDDLQAAESILRGLKRRFNATHVKPILIHMSGTGCLGDRAQGAFSSETVYNDLDIAQIETLPATQPHRNVDLAIVEADNQGYTDTYIVLPGLVFGTPHGILAREAVQNPTNLALTGFIRASFTRGAAGLHGEAKNMIAVADVTEGQHRILVLCVMIHARNVYTVADLVNILYDSVVANSAQIGHGRNGYYFVSSADVVFEKLVDVIESRAGKRRAFTQEELDLYFPNQPSLQSFFGDNGRADSARSRALGWKPVKATEEFLVALRDEVEHWQL